MQFPITLTWTQIISNIPADPNDYSRQELIDPGTWNDLYDTHEAHLASFLDEINCGWTYANAARAEYARRGMTWDDNGITYRDADSPASAREFAYGCMMATDLGGEAYEQWVGSDDDVDYFGSYLLTVIDAAQHSIK